MATPAQRIATLAINASTRTAREYSPRKQLVWQQCQSYLQRKIFLLVQIDSMDTNAMIETRLKLHQLGLAIKMPKPGILRKALRVSPFRSLEAAIIGPTFVAVSQREPHELKEALAYLQMHKKLTLLAGKIDTHILALEGLCELITSVPAISVQRTMLLGLIQASSLHLVNTLEGPSIALARLLHQRETEMIKETSST